MSNVSHGKNFSSEYSILKDTSGSASLTASCHKGANNTRKRLKFGYLMYTNAQVEQKQLAKTGEVPGMLSWGSKGAVRPSVLLTLKDKYNLKEDIDNIFEISGIGVILFKHALHVAANAWCTQNHAVNKLASQ